MTGYLKLSDFSTRGMQQLNNEIILQILKYLSENNNSGNVDIIEIIDNLTIKLDENTDKIYVDFSQLTSIDASIINGLEEFIQDISSEIDWNQIVNKPATFTPSEHTHDERYYTKNEMDNGLNHITDSLTEESHKVKLLASDEADYLQNKLDNVTLEVIGQELRVRNVSGLLIGVADINTWLSGTQGNIQNQINTINNLLTTITTGMSYIGKVETYAELQLVGNKDSGNLIVVLADESRSGGRSLYVFREDINNWEFIGEFVFSDEFIKLKDTPLNYNGANGKVLKVDEVNQKIIFSDIDYGELKNKPTSTITQIDNTVSKSHTHSNLQLLETYNQTNTNLTSAVNQSHTHSNKSSIDKLGVNANGELLIDGNIYVPKKQLLYARRGSSDQTLAVGDTCVFNSSVKGDIPYNSSTGEFTLTAGKMYRVTVTASMNTEGYVVLRLVDTNNTQPHTNSAIWTDVTKSWKEASAGNLEVVVTPATSKNFKIYASSVNGISSLRSAHSAIIIQEL